MHVVLGSIGPLVHWHVIKSYLFLMPSNNLITFSTTSKIFTLAGRGGGDRSRGGGGDRPRGGGFKGGQSKADKECNYCHEYGHFARECPTAPQNRGKSMGIYENMSFNFTIALSNSEVRLLILFSLSKDMFTQCPCIFIFSLSLGPCRHGR